MALFCRAPGLTGRLQGATAPQPFRPTPMAPVLSFPLKEKDGRSPMNRRPCGVRPARPFPALRFVLPQGFRPERRPFRPASPPLRPPRNGSGRAPGAMARAWGVAARRRPRGSPTLWRRWRVIASGCSAPASTAPAPICRPGMCTASSAEAAMALFRPSARRAPVLTGRPQGATAPQPFRPTPMAPVLSFPLKEKDGRSLTNRRPCGGRPARLSPALRFVLPQGFRPERRPSRRPFRPASPPLRSPPPRVGRAPGAMAGARGAAVPCRPLGSSVLSLRAGGRQGGGCPPKTGRPQTGGGASRPRLVRPFAPVPFFVPSRYARPALGWPDPSPSNGGRAPGPMAGAWGAVARRRPLGSPMPPLLAGGRQGGGRHPKTARLHRGGGATRPCPVRSFAPVPLFVPSRYARPALWWPDPSPPRAGRAPGAKAGARGAGVPRRPLGFLVPPFLAGGRQGGGRHPKTGRPQAGGGACRPRPASRLALGWSDPSSPSAGRAPGAMAVARGAVAPCRPLGFLVPPLGAGGRQGGGCHPKTGRPQAGGGACRPRPASRPALWWPDPSSPSAGRAPGAMAGARGAAAPCRPLGSPVPPFRAGGRQGGGRPPKTERPQGGGGACRPRLASRPALGWSDPSSPSAGRAPGAMAVARGRGCALPSARFPRAALSCRGTAGGRASSEDGTAAGRRRGVPASPGAAVCSGPLLRPVALRPAGARVARSISF